jgi:hypothetical protein
LIITIAVAAEDAKAERQAGTGAGGGGGGGSGRPGQSAGGLKRSYDNSAGSSSSSSSSNGRNDFVEPLPSSFSGMFGEECSADSLQGFL